MNEPSQIRIATCECCRRNDAPHGEPFCQSCAHHHLGRDREPNEADLLRERNEALREEMRLLGELNADSSLAPIRGQWMMYRCRTCGSGDEPLPVPDEQAIERCHAWIEEHVSPPARHLAHSLVDGILAAALEQAE